MAKIVKVLIFIFFFVGISLPIGYGGTEKVIKYNYQKELIKKEVNNDYYAILEIPRINLKREIYKLNDKNNNVNKNLMLIRKSIMPKENFSNVIIAGHSGVAYNAYFKNLYKLKVGDEVKLYYNNNLYIYLIEEIEEQPKTGELYLKENYPEMITLITCTKNNKKTQTIYYGKLKNKENNVKK